MAKPVYKFLEVFPHSFEGDSQLFYIPLKYEKVVENFEIRMLQTNTNEEYEKLYEEFYKEFGKYSAEDTKLYIRSGKIK